jgi:hypothetical protein
VRFKKIRFLIKFGGFFAIFFSAQTARNNSWAAVSWYNREQKELNASMSNLHARIEALLQRLIIIGMKVEDIY